MQGEIDVCITVTLTDGVVVARSAFHHSLNYRSVVALGKAQAITDPTEKNEALNKITNHLLPGRVAEVGTGMSSLQMPQTFISIRRTAEKVRTDQTLFASQKLMLGALCLGLHNHLES